MMTVVNAINLVLMTISALSMCNENKRETNSTKAKLKMAYLFPWTGHYPVGKTMGPVILKAMDNIRKRELLSNYDIENITGKIS